MRAGVEWTTRDERRRIIDEALALLERVGMQFGEGDALRLLGEAGARVDAERGLARLPAELVTNALRGCSRDIVLGGASDRRSYEHWETAGSDELVAASAHLDVLLAEGEARGPLLDDAQVRELEACVHDVVAAARRVRMIGDNG